MPTSSEYPRNRQVTEVNEPGRVEVPGCLFVMLMWTNSPDAVVWSKERTRTLGKDTAVYILMEAPEIRCFVSFHNSYN